MNQGQGRSKARAPRCWAALLLCLVPSIAPAAAAAGPANELQTALAARPDAARGAQLYGTCAACHGVDGGGVADGSIPAIGGQPQRVIVKQLVDFRRSQRLDIRMEHFADRRHLPDAQDLADVAAHVEGLVRGVPVGIGSGVALGAGASAWFTACESCHGATGQADSERLLPRLAGQHAAYLERQLFDSAAGRRPNMTKIHRRLLAGFTAEQIPAIADYLSRMK